MFCHVLFHLRRIWLAQTVVWNSQSRGFYQGLQVDDTGSLSVNQYGWINIWMAILGHFFTRFPVFFESTPVALKTRLEIFQDTAGNVRIYALHFSPLVGIKRGARLILKSTRRIPRVATSSRAKTLLWLRGLSYGAAVEVIRDNEPLYSAESVAPFWCAHVPRNLHLCFAYLPMLYPSRRFSGLQSRSVTED